MDHFQTTNCLNVTKVQWLVLDEADRLLDMGFEQDIVSIVNHLKQKSVLLSETNAKIRRRHVLCSATLDQNVQRLAKFSLMDPVQCFADDKLTNKDLQNNANGEQEGMFKCVYVYVK